MSYEIERKSSCVNWFCWTLLVINIFCLSSCQLKRTEQKERIDDLEAHVTYLYEKQEEAEIDDLKSKIDDLESRVDDIEFKLNRF